MYKTRQSRDKTVQISELSNIHVHKMVEQPLGVSFWLQPKFHQVCTDPASKQLLLFEVDIGPARSRAMG